MPPEPAFRTGLGLALGLDGDLAQDDWPAAAADTIVSVVEKVRDRTTGPAITGEFAVVFGRSPPCSARSRLRSSACCSSGSR